MLALGVPTIWMSLIQVYQRALLEQPGRWKLPVGMRSLVDRAARRTLAPRRHDR